MILASIKLSAKKGQRVSWPVPALLKHAEGDPFPSANSCQGGEELWNGRVRTEAEQKNTDIGQRLPCKMPVLFFEVGPGKGGQHDNGGHFQQTPDWQMLP